MTAQEQNPYQSPAFPSEQAPTAGALVLPTSERSGVWWFFVVNNIIGGLLIALGLVSSFGMGVAAISGLSQGGLGIEESMTVFGFGVIYFLVLGTWGYFHLKRSIVAITISGVLAAAILAIYLVAGVVVVVRSGAMPSLGDLIVIPLVVGMALLFYGPPVWVAWKAWSWRLRGIDIKRLNNVVYADTLDPANTMTQPIG